LAGENKHIESNRPGVIRAISGCILEHYCLRCAVLLASPAIVVGSESLWSRALPSDENHRTYGSSDQESVWRSLYALRLDTASDGRVGSGYGIVHLEHARAAWQHHRRDRPQRDLRRFGVSCDGGRDDSAVGIALCDRDFPEVILTVFWSRLQKQMVSVSVRDNGAASQTASSSLRRRPVRLFPDRCNVHSSNSHGFTCRLDKPFQLVTG
jgi:hypothetical protein